MKKIINLFFILSVMSVFVFTSCKKDVEGCMDSSATNYNPDATKDDGSCKYAASTPEPYTPKISGEYALLAAINTVSSQSTPIGPVDVNFGTAVAVFSAADGTRQDAGTVTVDGEELSKQGNNSYTFIPEASQSMGLQFGNTIQWEGSGADWPAFSASTTTGLPGVEKIASGDVSIAADYTLAADNVSNSDSVLFGVYGPSDFIYEIVAGNTRSYTFTSAQLSSLGKGNGIIQIVGLNYDKQTIAGKNYWLINETARSLNIKITD